MKLTFSKIHRESIFNADFDNLKEDSGTIEFKIKKYVWWYSGSICSKWNWKV